MKNTTGNSLRGKAVIPHIFVVLWLIYLGAMIWQHGIRSVQVPQFDPLTYMQKAMNFWKAVDQAKLFNPLNIEPTTRPPGTILMSYPLGFTSDFKGFYFRSIFFPILCIVIAVYMVAGIARSFASGWDVAAIAILFSALPMFYNFDANEFNSGPSIWGLVDNFQAGIAAMAAAGYVKSVKARSWVWLMCGAFFGAFTLLIKPSGLMVMALLTATWLIAVAMEWLCTRKYQQSNSNLYRYMIIGGILTFLIYSVVVLLCIFSNYFSIQNFAFAKHALKVMGDVEKNIPPQILFLLLNSVGIAFVFWVIGNGVVIIYDRFSRDSQHNPLSEEMVGLLLSIPVTWSLGVWYWLVVQAGGSQVRYFHPFFLMGAIFLIPISLHIIYHSHRWICLAGFALCLLPALNIGVILALESPSILWQQLTGVNVAVGKDREEVTQAYTFLEELRRQNKRATLYSFFSGALPDIFITVGVYEEIVRPDLPVFKSISTVDWMNGFVVKTDQLLGADYILIRKDLGQKAEKLSERPIDTSDSENIVFQEWLSGLSENAGVKAVSDGRVLRLLEIIDRKEFERAVELFVSSHSWRSEFIAANLLPRWSNEEEVFGYVKNPAMKEIEFEGIYVLHALSICHSDTGLNVELWWEELRHEKTMRQWYMFFQLLDRSGKILLDQVLTLDKYDPPFDNRRWRYGSVTFENLLPKEAASLAFGIFRPKDDFLMPDKGFRDWGGVRILITIPSIDIKSATDNTNDTSVFSILSDREIPNGPT